MKETAIYIKSGCPLIRSGILWELHKAGYYNIVDCSQNIDLSTVLNSVLINVLIIDFEKPERSTFDLIKELVNTYSNIKVLVLCSEKNQSYTSELLKIGVNGFVSHNEAVDNIILAVETAIKGQVWFSSSIREVLVTQTSMKSKTSLGERELIILRMLAHGRVDKEIAAELRISERMVRYDLRKIYDKLNVSTKLQAISWTIEQEYIKD